MTRRSLGSILGALLILLLAAFTVGPSVAKKELELEVKRHCPGCALEIGQLKLSPFYGEVRLQDVRFHYREEGKLDLNAHCPSIEARVDLLTLLASKARHVRVRALRFDRPQVTVSEPEHKRKTRPERHELAGKAANENAPHLIVDHTEIANAHFTFEKDEGKSEPATLRISQIDAKLNRFEARGERLLQPVTANVTAKLENSGHLTASLKAESLSSEPRVHMDLDIRNMDLSQTNSYFSVSDEIWLQGLLEEGRGQMFMDGSRIRGQLTARYRDFDVQFRSGKERGGIKAWLMNFGKNLKLRKSNVGPDQGPTQASIQRSRKPDESLVRFVLESMKDAAMKVATTTG